MAIVAGDVVLIYTVVGSTNFWVYSSSGVLKISKTFSPAPVNVFTVNGVVFLHRGGGVLTRLDENANELDSRTITAGGQGRVAAINTRGFIQTGSAAVTAVDAYNNIIGTVTAPSYLSDGYPLGADSGDDVLYLMEDPGGAGDIIQQVKISTGVKTTLFNTPSGAFTPNTSYVSEAWGVLKLASGKYIVGVLYENVSTLQFSSALYRVSASGAVEQTFSSGALSANGLFGQLSHVFGDSDAFWVTNYTGGAKKIKASDGTVLVTITLPIGTKNPASDQNTKAFAVIADRPAPSTPPETNNQAPCCSDTPGEATTGGQAGTTAVTPAIVQESWVRTAAGGGAVDVVADVDEGEDWSAERGAPNAWIAVTIQKQPTSEGTLEYRSSMSTLADPDSYYGGLKVGEVNTWNTVERALSDWKGEFEVGTFSVVLNDRSGRWRALLGSDTTKWVTGADLVLRLISEAGRKAGDTPRRLFAGKIARPEPRGNRQFGLVAEALLGSQYGPYDLDKPVLSRTWGDWGATVPDDVKNKPVPFLWGEVSDRGTVDTDGVSKESGMIVPTYLGEVFVGSTPGTPPVAATFLHPPSGLTITIHGTGVTVAAACAVSAKNENGQTTMGTVVQVPNYPKNPTSSFYASWTWNAPDNGTATSYQVYIREGGGVPRYQLDEMNNGGSFTDPETAYTDDGDDSHFKTFYPPPPTTNTAQITGGSPGSSGTSLFYGVYGLLGHAGQVIDVYASDLEASPTYVKVQSSEIGTGKSFLVPGESGWPYPDNFLEKNGQRWFFFLAKGPKSEAHKSGQMPLRVNLAGWDDDNDGTGLVIDQAWRVYQDILTQLILGDGGRGYWEGARLTIPTFPNDASIPMIKSTTFEDAQDVTKIFTSDSIGYRLAVYLADETVTRRQLIATLNDNIGGRVGPNAIGQTIASHLDDTMDASSSPRVLQFRDILQWPDPSYSDNEIENLIEYEFDFTPAEQTYRGTPDPVASATSLAGYGERKASKRSWPYIRDANVATDRIGRELLHRSTIPRMQPIVLDLRGMQYEVGQVIRASHKDGVGSVDGDVDTPFYIERHIADLARGTVTLVGREVGYLFSSAFPITLAADGEDDGVLFADGESGGELR